MPSVSLGEVFKYFNRSRAYLGNLLLHRYTIGNTVVQGLFLQGFVILLFKASGMIMLVYVIAWGAWATKD